MKIYLDNNAGTPLDPKIAASLQNFLSTSWGNPSSIHSFGQSTKSLLTACRHKVANYLKVQEREVIFTSSGTESMNFLIGGILDKFPNGHVVSSNVEHACVKKTLKLYESKGFQVTYLPVGLGGALNIEDVKKAIRSDTRLIVTLAVNNETGIKNEWENIAGVALQANIPFLVDAVALLGKEDFTIPDGVSGMGFSGHKLHALPGVGAAFVRSKLKFQPFIEGGGQEFGYRGGSENLLGILSFAEAIELLSVNNFSTLYMQSLRDKLESGLQRKLQGIIINGIGTRVCNTSSLSFTGVDGESLLIALDQAGIAVSHGSACSSGGREPSRVLTSMGLPATQVRSSIRISLSRMTKDQEIDCCLEVIPEIVNKLRNFQKFGSGAGIYTHNSSNFLF